MDRATEFAVRGGFTDHRTRVYASIRYTGPDKDVNDMISYDIKQYDMLINLEAQTDPWYFTDKLNAKAFVGGHAGAIYGKVDKDVGHISQDDSDYGLAYGAQGGVIFDFSSSINMEVGYRYTWTNLSVEQTDLDSYDAIYGAFNLNF